MINSKRNVAIALFAVLAGVVLGVTWWLAQDRASAQEILYSACEQTAGQQSFDFVTKASAVRVGEPTEALEYSASVSGDDYSLTITNSDLGLVLDVVRVDGTVFYKDRNSSDWVTGQWSRAFDLPLIHFLLNSKAEGTEGVDVLCPDVGAVARVGSEMIGDVPVEHFQIMESYVGPVGGVDDLVSDPSGGTLVYDEYISGRSWDYWVNSDGFLVQAKQSIVMHDAISGSSSSVAQIDVATSISGIGDPNVIAVP